MCLIQTSIYVHISSATTQGTAETGSTFSTIFSTTLSTTLSTPKSNSDVVAASAATVVAVLLLLVGVAVTATLCLVVKRTMKNHKVTLRKVEGDKNTLPELM